MNDDKKCENCAHSCKGFFTPERLYCCNGEGMREVEHKGKCKNWLKTKIVEGEK